VKLKCIPEDFHVEEITSVLPGKGAFGFYRLEKQSIGTPEAIAAIVNRWNVHRRQISYGGLKDKHAATSQFLTIHQGPRKHLRQKSFDLQYLGQTSQPFTPAEITGNRFTIVLRDMRTAEIVSAQAAINELSTSGLPNYYDDQRFGSLGHSGEWIGKSWCLGDYQRALWLALADPHPQDSSEEKRQKQILREFWDRWPECKQALSRSHRRSIVTYLSDKVEAGLHADYRGAFARISVDLRGLYLSAFQSALWNRLLTRYLKSILQPAQQRSFALLSGECLFPASLSDEQSLLLRNLQLPLPSARIDHPDGPVGEQLTQVLSEEQMELRQIRVKYPRDSFFSRGQRDAVVFSQDLHAVAQDDDLYAQRQKLTLSFALPRGSYATILVKRLTEFS
jgi:tRNA pseudouridine13 synthase